MSAYKFPPEWGDDESMDVLFSPFRETRAVNPHSWDRKLKFWTDLIFDYCNKNGMVILKPSELPLMFERKERTPVCLSRVLEELTRKGKLQSLENFTANTPDTWLSWGFHWAVKKPAYWTMNTFIKRPLLWSFSQLTGSEPTKQTNLPSLVVTDVVQELAGKILSRHQHSIKHETTDCIVDCNELYNKNKDLFKDRENFHMAVLQLAKDRKCVLFNTDKNQKVVRFAKSNKRSVTPPNDCDTKIYKLKAAEKTLEEQIVQLIEESDRLRSEAKSFVRQGLKTSAKNSLRRKKQVEALRGQKETALENIHHLITVIQQADSNKMVLDAYSSGNDVFKQISKQYGLTPDMVDDVMSDLEETFEMQDDVNRSISQNPMAGIDPSMDDLEDELTQILAGGQDDDDKGEVMVEDELPSVPVGFGDVSPLPDDSFERDLLADLSNLDISSGDADLKLPDVPQFNPSSAGTSAFQRPAQKAGASTFQKPAQQAYRKPMSQYGYAEPAS